MLYIIGALNDNLAVYLTIMPVGADAHIGPYNCVVYGSTLNDNLALQYGTSAPSLRELSPKVTEGERWERRLWRMKRPERVAVVGR